MPLDIANSYLLKYNKRKRGTPEELNQVGADVSNAGIDKGHVLESDSDAIVYFDTESGNDSTGDGSSGNPYKTYNKAQTIEAGDASKTTIEQLNDYPLIYDGSNDVTSDLQFTTAQLSYKNDYLEDNSNPIGIDPIDLATLSNRTSLCLGKYVNYQYRRQEQVGNTYVNITQTDSYVVNNNPERIFVYNDEFYLFYSEKTYKADSSCVFDQLSVASAKAYDMTTTSQVHVKVTDASPAAPSDVGTWGTTEWWDGTSAEPSGAGSWRSNVGLKGLVTQPLNFSSKTELGIPSELDDDESINCITSDSNDRVWIGTVNPDAAAGTYSGRIFYSDDLSNWTLSHTVSGTDSEGIRKILCTKSDHIYAYSANAAGTTLTGSRYVSSWTNETVYTGTSIFRINAITLDNGTLVTVYDNQSSNDYYQYAIIRAADGSFSQISVTDSSSSNPDELIYPTLSFAIGYNYLYIQVVGRGTYLGSPAAYPFYFIYATPIDENAANVKYHAAQSGKTYKGCIMSAVTNSSTIDNSIVYSVNTTSMSLSNSHVQDSGGNLSDYTALTNSRLGSLNYDTTSTITGLTIDSLSQSTVNVLNATRCKFLAQSGTITLAGGATLTECYFAGTWQHAIANGQTYSINHCTWNGSAEFNTATAPSAWTSENCIFLNLTFPDITTGNEVDISYGGIVGTLTGVDAGENVRRDNPLFSPGTDGKLQRTLDGFLQDSPYIRQASDTNASTGANKDLGAYNIDDSLIVADYGTSIYLPKPPGGSITITETPLASVHTAISGQPDVFNDPNKRTEQVEITYPNIDSDVYEVYQEIETTLENMSVYLALDPYYLTDLPSVTTSAAASIGQTFIEIDPTVIFAGSRFSLSGIEYFIRYKVLNSSNQTTKIVIDRPLESAVSLGASLSLTHPVGTGEYQYIPQPRTFTRVDSQDMEVKGPFKIVLVRKPE